ncbi:MAG: hypothetical protein H7257_10025 [Taibaiella sp.]|nr:hypothetical protein [Taibaiella sp.]
MNLQLKNILPAGGKYGLLKIFAGLWLLTFALYLPAMKAGFVADFTGWLEQTQHYGFWDNINRTHYHGHSLYQFTQFNTWVLFQFFGTNAMLWHLLSVTLHAVNALLLYNLGFRLLHNSNTSGARFTALAGSLLFCVSPHASEVVVWESSYHFLQGLLLLLVVLNLSWQYLQTHTARHAVAAVFVYFLSSFSLEIFYITPWLVLTLALFYHWSSGPPSTGFLPALVHIFLPLIVIFIFHIILFRVVYGGWVAHIGSDVGPAMPALGWNKPAKLLFHILFLGRFFSDAVRHTVYDFLDSAKGICAFYGALAVIIFFVAVRFRQLSVKAKLAAMLFGWVCITLALLMPLWFPDYSLVVFDRYTYFTSAFIYILLALLLTYIRLRYVRAALAIAYILINTRYALQVNRYWMKSERIISNLLLTFPYKTDRTVVLLNVPQNMHGVPMIGAEQESELKLMHDGLVPAEKINTKVYDAMAYNMLTPDDGANVTVLNDSTLKVTLNQWGTWWWYAMRGGNSYENNEYRLDLKDPGHWYELTLKHPAANYMLLYQVGNQWKVVDMGKREEQR